MTNGKGRDVRMECVRESFSQFLRRTWWIWAALLTLYSCVAAKLPAMDDEVYYWSWSKSLQWSYYDHPGMTAWLIWLSTRIFGDTVLAMRFPACCCVTLTLAIITFLTSATQSPPTASAGRLHPLILGVALTPLFTFGGILITPDAPLIACWSMYLLWLVMLQESHVISVSSGWHAPESSKGVDFEPQPRPSQNLRDVPPIHWWKYWLVGGILLGLGGLSKYTMILAVPAGFVSLLLSGIPWRKWFWGYLGHGVVSVIVASPILLYNVQHHFEPLLFQWRHAMHDEPATAITFAEFFGVQMLLFGTLPFYIVPWMIRRRDHLRISPRLRVCSSLYLVPLAFFVYKAARTELEGNWGLVAFLSVWPVAAAWYDTVKTSRNWRWAAAASFLAPAICVTALAIHILSPLPFIPVAQDRLSKQRARWEMSQTLAKFIQERGESIPTFCYTYQMTALLRFRGIDARQEGTSRPSHYTFPPQSLNDFAAGYLVTDPIAMPLPIDGMSAELIGSFPTVARGKTVHEYQLWRYEKKIGELNSRIEE